MKILYTINKTLNVKMQNKVVLCEKMNIGHWSQMQFDIMEW